jgi:hypothetical protein
MNLCSKNVENADEFYCKAGPKVVWYDESLKVESDAGLLVIGGVLGVD